MKKEPKGYSVNANGVKVSVKFKGVADNLENEPDESKKEIVKKVLKTLEKKLR